MLKVFLILPLWLVWKLFNCWGDILLKHHLSLSTYALNIMLYIKHLFGDFYLVGWHHRPNGHELNKLWEMVTKNWTWLSIWATTTRLRGRSPRNTWEACLQPDQHPSLGSGFAGRGSSWLPTLSTEPVKQWQTALSHPAPPFPSFLAPLSPFFHPAFPPSKLISTHPTSNRCWLWERPWKYINK